MQPSHCVLSPDNNAVHHATKSNACQVSTSNPKKKINAKTGRREHYKKPGVADFVPNFVNHYHVIND